MPRMSCVEGNSNLVKSKNISKTRKTLRKARPSTSTPSACSTIFKVEYFIF